VLGKSIALERRWAEQGAPIAVARKLIAAFPRQLVQDHLPAMSKLLLLKKKVN
jgi:hypothetical protein